MKLNDYLRETFFKMLNFREAAGYATVTYKVTLLPFIDFCCYKYPDAENLTAEMLDERLTHKGYTVNTQAAFIACLRQYCRYINFLGNNYVHEKSLYNSSDTSLKSGALSKFNKSSFVSMMFSMKKASSSSLDALHISIYWTASC